MYLFSRARGHVTYWFRFICSLPSFFARVFGRLFWPSPVLTAGSEDWDKAGAAGKRCGLRSPCAFCHVATSSPSIADHVALHPYMVSAATCSPQESADQSTGADWRAAAMPFC